MPSFRIHRLKDHLRQNFRSAPHLSGTASVKPRDYERPKAMLWKPRRRTRLSSLCGTSAESDSGRRYSGVPRMALCGFSSSSELKRRNGFCRKSRLDPASCAVQHTALPLYRYSTAPAGAKYRPPRYNKTRDEWL